MLKELHFKVASDDRFNESEPLIRLAALSESNWFFAEEIFEQEDL